MMKRVAVVKKTTAKLCKTVVFAVIGQSDQNGEKKGQPAGQFNPLDTYKRYDE